MSDLVRRLAKQSYVSLDIPRLLSLRELLVAKSIARRI
jgi:hypothetical protein